MLAPVAALAWWWAGRAVRPIDRIRSVAEHIEATDLRRASMTNGPTEVLRLAASFDAMLDRLHGAANRQREAIDEISHELRTPIAVLVTNADVRLARAGGSEWYRDGLEQSRRTAERMRTILDRLLVDARSYAYTMDRHPADLMEVIRAGGLRRWTSWPRPGRCDQRRRPAHVTGAWDSEMLARAVTNLLDNAVRHSPDGGEVRVAVRRAGGGVGIAVSDHGPGIPSASGPRTSSSGRGVGTRRSRRARPRPRDRPTDRGGARRKPHRVVTGSRGFATTFVLTLRL